MSLQKPWFGIAHVRRQATAFGILVVLEDVLVVRFGDEEGGDGGDAVLELLEGVYTVAKAVLDGDVGS